jgi:hypothetical protein
MDKGNKIQIMVCRLLFQEAHTSTKSFPSTRRTLWPWLAIVTVLVVTTYQLRRQGRLWWCSCGQLFLWSGDTWSSHNSQHLFDPYSFTHILHGFVFCRLLAWGTPRLAPVWRLWLAISMEALWEVAENSDFIIQRYREATAALGYQGDTIVNTLGDILCCGTGFVLAQQLGVRRSLALFVATEGVLLIWIRDSLILNVVMLIYPIDAIKAWQLGSTTKCKPREQRDL